MSGEEPGKARRSPMQYVHAATEDRDAEARALADQASEEVDFDDARLAVARARGETADEPAGRDHVATPDEAEQAHAQRVERESEENDGEESSS